MVLTIMMAAVLLLSQPSPGFAFSIRGYSNLGVHYKCRKSRFSFCYRFSIDVKPLRFFNAAGIEVLGSNLEELISKTIVWMSNCSFPEQVETSSRCSGCQWRNKCCPAFFFLFLWHVEMTAFFFLLMGYAHVKVYSKLKKITSRV